MLSRRGASEAGRLRHRVVLEKRVGTADGAGGAATSWTTAATLFAEIAPVSGDEEQVGEGLVERTSHRVVIRFRSDVGGGDRLRLGDRLLDIRAAFDPDQDGRWLVCLADERRTGA